jgi:DNA-binding transcriptional LysR family regulator
MPYMISMRMLHHDLSLSDLGALEALLEEKHVTRAAERIGLSQSAMSRTLARLRRIFADELLVQTKGGYLRTSRGDALLDPVRSAKTQLLGLIDAERFEPSAATGFVTIEAGDYVGVVLLPRVIERLEHEAPGLELRVTAWRDRWEDRLATQETDLTFGVPSGNQPYIYVRDLLKDRFITVVRRGHPILRGAWNAQRFASYRHAITTVQGDGPGQVDLALDKLGLERRITLRLPFSAALPVLVAQTNLVLTTSHLLATKMKAFLPIVLRPPPIELPNISFPMLWHERTHRDPRQAWLRKIIAEEADALAPRVKGAKA